MLSFINISRPTKDQIIHSLERVVGVFLTAAYASWQLQGHQIDRASIHAAIIAGGLAAWQLITSVFTTL